MPGFQRIPGTDEEDDVLRSVMAQPPRATIAPSAITDLLAPQAQSTVSPSPPVDPPAGLGLQRPSPLVRSLVRANAESRYADPRSAAPAGIRAVLGSEPDPYTNRTAPAPTGQPLIPQARDVEQSTENADAAQMTAPVADGAPPAREKAYRTPEMTPQEKNRLHGAETMDRRSQIAGGVLQGLGGLMALFGPTGSNAAGLGSAMVSGTRSLTESNTAAPVRAAIAERQAQEAQGLARIFEQEQAQRGQAREDAAFALRERQAASDEALNQARIDGLISEQEARDLDRASREGNTAAARATLASRVAAIQHAPTRQAWEARLADMLQAEDPEQLLDQTRFAAATDIRRGGQGAGGSGGGSTRTYTDADGNIREVRTPGRRTMAQAPGAPAAPGAAPRGPAPAAPPAAAPANPDEMEMDLNAAIRDAIVAQGIDPASERGRQLSRAYWLQANQGGAGSRAQLLTQLRTEIQQSAESEVGGGPPGVPPREHAEFVRRVTPLQTSLESTRRFRQRVTAYSRAHQQALQTAMSHLGRGGSVITDLDERTQSILSDLSGWANAQLRERSGAAVTDQELRRYLTEMGAGRWTNIANSGGVRVLIEALQRQEDEWAGQIGTVLDASDARERPWYVDRFVTRGER